MFERNTAFDTPGLKLRKAAALLRIREAGRVTTATYKGRPTTSKHKSREEVELEIHDARAMGVIFERLGFRPVWRYEKYRTEYRQASGQGTAMLDETPLGIYLELEGPPAWIDRTARQMGFAETDYITASYARLWQQANGRKMPGDMVFEAGA